MQPSSTEVLLLLLCPGAKGKVPRKPKAQKKREEGGEGRTKGKAQGEELLLRDDNDDSSSTTTETSNTDTEASLKEVPHRA